MEASSSEPSACVCSNGCGCSAESGNIIVSVTPTTGGQFDLSVTKNDSIENLKKLISKRLKVPKERICLLHRERQLRGGTLQENQLVNGSRLTLLPSIETGLLAQRPEQSVMQALESLNDSQVNDFLSGKAPLNLTMRLGDHMMLIQLQLSSVAPNGAGSSSGSSVKRSNNGGSASVATTSSIKSSSSVGSLSVPQVAVAAPAPLRHPTAIPSSSGGANPRTSTAGIVDCSCGGAAGASGASNLSVTSADATAASPATGKPVLDTKALVEASRNLTQTLKQLSSEVFTSKSSDLAEDASSLKRRQGAIIESMHHHGKGVYSGTFSGTLNPALQDRFGRPKRDISTIIHILNDLLCATPQYRAATHEPAKQSPPSSTISTATTASSSTSCSSESSLTSDHVAESDENRATRGKMERLRLVLGQRRERRRAMRAQPYPTGHDHVTA
ncbi:Midnolin [Nesidiocoris tenuis]|uniref:Midnolin n=1 Tax=Nesidiocoris tenuis TaxID=355587 RepID=A0ABN7BDM4_9HEMI|nr:Midnolin [Nesidiocoris tenuis]